MRAGGSGIRAGSTTRWPRHDPRSERGIAALDRLSCRLFEVVGHSDNVAEDSWKIGKLADRAGKHG